MTMLPRQDVPIASSDGRATNPFYFFLQDLERAAAAGPTGLQEQITGIARALGSPDGTVSGIPEQTTQDIGLLIGQQSVRVSGSLANGNVFVMLQGDQDAPGPTYAYGTNAEGQKGWFALADGLLEGEGVALSVDATGRITFGLAPLPDTGGGTLQKTARDQYGRVSGTSEATTGDLPEGGRLYFTDERARAAAVTDAIDPEATDTAPSGRAVAEAIETIELTPGPEGPEGPQGPKGDTGDVTPEALAARDAAVDAADAASQSADLAEQARLLGATIGFATKADMDASLAHPDGMLALVTSDATPANNGTYRKTGASGSGQWVRSADRVTGLEGRTAAIEHEASALLEESTSVRAFGDSAQAVAPASNRSVSYYFIFDVRVPESSVRVSRVRVWSRAAGSFEVSIWRNTSGTTWTKVASATRSATITASPVWYDVSLQALPGDRVGFKPLTEGAIGQVGGDSSQGYGTVPAAASSFDSTTVTLAESLIRASWEVETVLPFRADSSRLERLLSRRRYGSVSMRNIRESQITNVQTVVFATPMPAGVSRVTRLGFNHSSGAIYEVSNWRDNGSGQFVRVGSVTVQTSTDETESTEFRIGTLDLPVREGDRIGLSRNPSTFALNVGYASGQLEFQQIPNGAESFSPGATTTAALRLWFEVDGAFRDQDPPSRFSRKTVWSFGDSFTNGSLFGSYPDALIDRLGANVVNYGRSGAFTGALVGIMTPADHRANSWTDKVDITYAGADAVTIMIGQNGGVSGSMSDIPAESIYAIPYVIGGTTVSTVKQHLERFGNTYYGNLGLILEYLRWVKPQMEVFLLSPTLSASRSSLDTFRVEMQALANHFGVRHIDTRAESGITLRNNSLTTYDGDHPSWAGMSMIARYVAAKMVG